MVTVQVCIECGGKGHYKIYNAYDPDFEEDAFCERCDGLGVVEDDYEEPPRKRPAREKDLAN